MMPNEAPTSEESLVRGYSLLQRAHQRPPSLPGNHTWLPLYMSLITALCLTVLYYVVVSFRRMYVNSKKPIQIEGIGEDQPLRKVRCTSMCVEMEVSTPKIERRNSLQNQPRSTIDSCIDIDNGQHISSLVILLPNSSPSSILTAPLPDAPMNITDLPYEILVCVFSLLPPESKNSASRTCKRFSLLLRSPYAWPVVDLTSYPRAPRVAKHAPAASPPGEYPSPYDLALTSYLRALARVRPRLRTFRLCIDSVDLCRHTDDLRAFLRSASGCCLRVAQFNFASTLRYDVDKDRAYLLRRRKRYYQHFLRQFAIAGTTSASSSQLRHLVLAYDWTEATFRCLAELKQLETLVLQRYHVIETGFSQHAIQKVLSAFQNLRLLQLSVHYQTPSGYYLLYLCSKSLRVLDVAETSGLYLGKLDMPSLRRIRVPSRPWNRIPLYEGATAAAAAANSPTPCMLNVVGDGTPALRYVNDAVYGSDESLRLLTSVCACDVHRDRVWIAAPL